MYAIILFFILIKMSENANWMVGVMQIQSVITQSRDLTVVACRASLVMALIVQVCKGFSV